MRSHPGSSSQQRPQKGRTQELMRWNAKELTGTSTSSMFWDDFTPVEQSPATTREVHDRRGNTQNQRLVVQTREVSANRGFVKKSTTSIVANKILTRIGRMSPSSSPRGTTRKSPTPGKHHHLPQPHPEARIHHPSEPTPNNSDVFLVPSSVESERAAGFLMPFLGPSGSSRSHPSNNQDWAMSVNSQDSNDDQWEAEGSQVNWFQSTSMSMEELPPQMVPDRMYSSEDGENNETTAHDKLTSHKATQSSSISVSRGKALSPKRDNNVQDIGLPGSESYPIPLLSESEDLDARERDVLKQAAMKYGKTTYQQDQIEASRLSQSSSSSLSIPNVNSFHKKATSRSGKKKQSSEQHLSSMSQNSSKVEGKRSSKGLRRFFGGVGIGRKSNGNKTPSSTTSANGKTYPNEDSFVSSSTPSEIVDPDAPTPRQSHRQKPHRLTPLDRASEDANERVRESVTNVSDESSVSEMTNPTFLPQQYDNHRARSNFIAGSKAAPPQTIVQSKKISRQTSVPQVNTQDPPQSKEDFPSNHPFANGVGDYSPTRSKLYSPTGSDDFSDPFFPPNNGLADSDDPCLDDIELDILLGEEKKEEDGLAPTSPFAFKQAKARLSPRRSVPMDSDELIKETALIVPASKPHSLRASSPSRLNHNRKDLVTSSSKPSPSRTMANVSLALKESPRNVSNLSVSPGMSEKLRKRQQRKVEKRDTIRSKDIASPKRLDVLKRLSDIPPKPKGETNEQKKNVSALKRHLLANKESAIKQIKQPPRMQQTRKSTKVQVSKVPMKQCRDHGDDDNRSFASACSDYKKLKDYVRRSRPVRDESDRQKHLAVSCTVDTVFSEYDETKIKDPMQRAGLRLLSAAVIPIQSTVRRHLALRTALTRMWGIVVLQSFARRVIAQKAFEQHVIASIILQAWFRGCKVREDMQYKHCCAIEIQRHVRGYLATLSVYEDIFRITIAQSIVRRKLAIDYATDRMIFIIQLQGLARGFLCRQRLQKLQRNATAIQTKWRSFYCQFNYQLDLLDIVIVQSLWRMKSVKSRYDAVQHARKSHAAIIIQSKWRTYSCVTAFRQYVRMYVAAVTVQSRFRCWICSKRYLDYVAATMIQAQWRGFVCFQRYTFVLAATLIQSQFRMSRVRKQYARHQAALRIQSHWRSYLCSLQYLHNIADILIIQSSVRRWLAQRYVSIFVNSSALTIQNAFRVYQANVRVKEIRDRNDAAVSIQRAWRGFSVYANYVFTVADIVLMQSLVRKMLACMRTTKLRDEKNRQLETKENMAAIVIQRNWRRFIAQVEYLIARCESDAATTIQSYWRRYYDRSNFAIANGIALHIQSFYRGYGVRKLLDKKHTAASCIQLAVRNVNARESERLRTILRLILSSGIPIETSERISATIIQAVVRGSQTRKAFDLYINARQIQKTWRMQRCRNDYVRYISARKIQAAWNGYCARWFFIDYTRARRIQCFWRQKHARANFVAMREEVMADTIKAAVVAQRLWRGVSVRMKGLKFIIWHRRLFIETPAAVKIQTAWRGYNAIQDYWHVLGSAIQIQSVVRAWQSRSQYLLKKESAVVVQTSVRRFLARTEVAEKLGCIILMQSIARAYFAKKEAAQRRLIYMFVVTAADSADKGMSHQKLRASKSSHSDWGMYGDEKQDRAARTIQRFFIMIKREVDHEIARAAAKKYRRKKKKKYRVPDMDDAMLENVWRKTVVDSKRAELRTRSRSQQGHHPFIGRRDGPPGQTGIPQPGARSVVRRQVDVRGNRSPSPALLHLPRVASAGGMLGGSNRYRTASPLSMHHQLPSRPPSRMTALSQDAIDQDLSLEEAWIDAEIHHAKERSRMEWPESTKAVTSRHRRKKQPSRRPAAISTAHEEEERQDHRPPQVRPPVRKFEA